jgi:hypothetical protein
LTFAGGAPHAQARVLWYRDSGTSSDVAKELVGWITLDAVGLQRENEHRLVGYVLCVRRETNEITLYGGVLLTASDLTR